MTTFMVKKELVVTADPDSHATLAVWSLIALQFIIDYGVRGESVRGYLPNCLS